MNPLGQNNVTNSITMVTVVTTHTSLYIKRKSLLQGCTGRELHILTMRGKCTETKDCYLVFCLEQWYPKIFAHAPTFMSKNNYHAPQYIFSCKY
jgi:hypothetical protein